MPDWTWALLAIGLGAVGEEAAPPCPAVTVRLAGPDRQLERAIALFRGAREAHPAAALASWRRTPEGRRGLGKGAEAAIALMNPAMVPELRALGDAEIATGPGSEAGEVRWRATLPRDDGTIGALATALVLTDGKGEAPLGAVAVDRLGPPGAPLMARGPEGLVIASSRDDLRVALGKDRPGAEGLPAIESGVAFQVVPEALRPSGSPARRRAVALLKASGLEAIEGTAALDGETLSVALTVRRGGGPPPRPAAASAPAPAKAIDPAWLDVLPGEATAAVVSVAIDPRGEAWASAFEAADRLERSQPGREKVASLRTRLNLIAAASGVRPETDLWPHLRGVSACLMAGRSGEVSGAMLALHADGEDSASRLAGAFVPRLARRFARPTEGEAPPTDPRIRVLGRVSGRPLSVALRGSTVLIGWGPSALSACLDAAEAPTNPEALALRSGWSGAIPGRAGGFWPGRLRLAPAGSPAALALAGAPPIVWSGRTEGPTSRDLIRWTDLSGIVRRFLEHLPLAPPPDRSPPFPGGSPITESRLPY